MSLVHYLSNCLKLPRHYAKVRDSVVTPAGQEHVTPRILAIVNPSFVKKKKKEEGTYTPWVYLLGDNL